MHVNTIQVTSLRMDGTAFQCTIPNEGKVWVEIPPNMQGHLVWKQNYTIGWTKDEKSKKGPNGEKQYFYKLKQLQSADDPLPVEPIPGPAAPGHSNPRATNGDAWTEGDEKATCAIFKSLLPLRASREDHDHLDNGWCAAILCDAADIWRRYKRAAKMTSVQNIEETF